MSLRPRKGTGRRAAKQREQKLRDKLHWKNQGGKEYGELFDRIQAIDEIRGRLTPSQRNRFLQIEDDFHNEQATPAFVDQDLMALEKELRGKSKSDTDQTCPICNSGQIHFTDDGYIHCHDCDYDELKETLKPEDDEEED